MALADVNTAMTAATAALESGDYATALVQAIKAGLYLAALPDSQKADRSLSWDRDAIDKLIARCRTLQLESQMSSQGIQRTKICHTRTSASS